MDRFDRIYKLHAILASSRHPVSRRRIMDELDCSRATFARIVEEMRGFLGAPLAYDRKENGYKYEQSGGDVYQLPGLWLNSRELYALITCRELLKTAGAGFLEENMAPLGERIEKIFQLQGLKFFEVANRVRILRIAYKGGEPAIFQKAAEGTLRRFKLFIEYHGRERDAGSQREISPQRLCYYRDNWYMDAYCHMRRALRTFALDRIDKITITSKKAMAIPEEELNAYFSQSYGIFSGAPKSAAILRFSPQVSPWVRKEEWHPAQRGKMTGDGSYELEIPYSDPRELVKDILKYGPDVEVIAPVELRKEVAEKLMKAAKRYQRPTP